VVVGLPKENNQLEEESCLDKEAVFLFQKEKVLWREILGMFIY
jgi:hypothetical protein